MILFYLHALAHAVTDDRTWRRLAAALLDRARRSDASLRALPAGAWTFGPRPPVIDQPPHEPSRIEPLGAQPRRITRAPSRDREPRAARRRTYLPTRPAG